MSQKTDRLIKRLNHLSAHYYDGAPLVSDEEYDQLREELTELEPDHPFLSQVGAPTAALSKNWPTHKHANLIGSLNKISDIRQMMPGRQELLEWTKGKGTEFILTEKYDGSTVVATYENGKLQVLATRGDGIEGEDITPNASKIQGVPDTLSTPFTGEVRGEAILYLDDFETHCKPKGHRTARNTANGKVRSQSADELQKFVHVMWFDIAEEDCQLPTESSKFISLKHLFPAEHVAAHQLLTLDGICAMYDTYFQTTRASLNHEIDGLVIKVNDLQLQRSLGVVSNRPKGAMALKFPALTKTTILLDVEWQQGLTGRISPVAILEPVDIGGVTIRRASLCNLDEIARLDVAIGDVVVISRRNDVIPKIECVHIKDVNRRPIFPPTHWNGEDIERDGAYLITTNLESQGFTFGNLMTWIQVTKMKGFGPAVIRNLIEEGVHDIADFYEADLATFQKAANSEKNGQKLFDARNALKEIRLSTFLSGLNIPTLGDTNASRLEKEFHTLDGILGKATANMIKEIPGIKTNADKIVVGLALKLDLIDRLRKLLTIKGLDNSGPLAGKAVCVTGDLSINRDDFFAWIKALGGETKSGVSKNLNYLITNEPDSGTSKNQKADEYGIPKVTEEQFYAIVGQKP